MKVLNFEIRKSKMVLYARGKVLVFDMFYCCMGANYVALSIFWLNEIFEKCGIVKTSIEMETSSACAQIDRNRIIFTGQPFSQLK